MQRIALRIIIPGLLLLLTSCYGGADTQIAGAIEGASQLPADTGATAAAGTDWPFGPLGEVTAFPSSEQNQVPGAVSDDHSDDAEALLIALDFVDSDQDGRSDFDELVGGTDPHDPTDGPDIDGDGIPNNEDADIDGDGVPNAYDDDIDGDGIENTIDLDRDADGLLDITDSDDDADEVPDTRDNDDDADGKEDPKDKPDDDDDAELPTVHPQEDDDAKIIKGLSDLLEQRKDGVAPEHDHIVEAIHAELKDMRERTDNARTEIIHRRLFQAVMQRLARRQGGDEVRQIEVLRVFEHLFDVDHDGLVDLLDPDPDGNGSRDDDKDKLSDRDEVTIGSNPKEPDTDFDGLADLFELKNDLNPIDSDSDNDGLTDGEEARQWHTNPLYADSDGDGLSDGDEVQTWHTNPLYEDTDGDGLQDDREVEIGTDPTDSDTDNDGTPDSQDPTPTGQNP